MKDKYYLFLNFFLLFIFIIVVYRVAFTLIPLSGGDYITFWPEHFSLIKYNSFFSWDSTTNLGASSVDILHSSPWNFLMATIGVFLGNNIVLTERLFWWIPFLILSVFSSLFLFKKFYPSNNFLLLSSLIFLFNTYALMMIGGGQIAGIGLAYAITPLVLGKFISLIDAFCEIEKFKHRDIFRKSLTVGLLLASQVMFDYRITYITIIAVLLYALVSIVFSKIKNFGTILSLLFYSFIIPFGITGLLHAFWILPTVFVKNDVLQQLGPAFTSFQSVQFFSFAKLENTISLLHPNWP
jgi:hypothetical protein